MRFQNKSNDIALWLGLILSTLSMSLHDRTNAQEGYRFLHFQGHIEGYWGVESYWGYGASLEVESHQKWGDYWSYRVHGTQIDDIYFQKGEQLRDLFSSANVRERHTTVTQTATEDANGGIEITEETTREEKELSSDRFDLLFKSRVTQSIGFSLGYGKRVYYLRNHRGYVTFKGSYTLVSYEGDLDHEAAYGAPGPTEITVTNPNPKVVETQKVEIVHRGESFRNVDATIAIGRVGIGLGFNHQFRLSRGMIFKVFIEGTIDYAEGTDLEYHPVGGVGFGFSL